MQICDRKTGKGIYEKSLDRTLKVLGTECGVKLNHSWLFRIMAGQLEAL